MSHSFTDHSTPLDLTLRIGCRFVYYAATPIPAVFLLQPRQDVWQSIRSEALLFPPDQHVTQHEGEHGNIIHRTVLQPGENIVGYDAIVAVPSLKDNARWIDAPHPLEELPLDVLRYTLPSRYCDSDRLLDFAWQKFGHLPHGLPRIQAISDWLHHHIEYRQFSGDPRISASEALARGHGVCRDFAHMAIALCRALNLPARYVSGYVPDIDFQDSGTPMDFHAYLEVYMGGRWQVFDARFHVPRTGRVRIATGYDAVSCAFNTYYGALALNHFEVWSYQIDPAEVHLGDPVDLSKRLCGTPGLRWPAPK